MDSSPLHDMMDTKLPAEKASIEGILKAMETTATADGLLHIATCVEANLSYTLANPLQSDEATQYIVDLHEILDEVRIRYAHTREKEIAVESNRLQDCLQSWGITKQPEAKFTPVKGKNKSRKNAEHQAAKKPRTEEPGCSNRFSSLTIEDKDDETEMDAGETTPMPSPTKPHHHPNPINHPPKPKAAAPVVNRWRQRAATSTPLQETQRSSPTITNSEEFPPLPSKPAAPAPTTQTNIEDPFTILKSKKCQTLYKELQQFVKIAENIPTKAGRMAALFKFIEEDNDS
ncbi:hypothetical protein NPIL_71811 [Nephila pilipes]|uniref:Uncharacterized protein n=1 Tax=Nephila pilipes TaxID=299642 RepID=A0A8X6PUD6_NEPPI|nr:hypothetical protein NPIL_71811 [Nephila pilipes]